VVEEELDILVPLVVEMVLLVVLEEAAVMVHLVQVVKVMAIPLQ
tara:strand:- start:269 stop:400 length:132 start_codon:yes stop_codon:yes gene_type:complete